MSDSSIPEPIPALQALGQVLRQGREGQGLGLPELAERLNMGHEQLRALEEGDAGRLPEPVFVIAQARRVANSLAIDVDGPLQTLRECDQFQARPLKVSALSPPASRRPTATPTATDTESPADSGGGGRPLPLQTIGRLALAAGLLVALIGAGSAGWQQWHRLQWHRLQWQRQQWQRQQVRQVQPAPPPTQPLDKGSQLLLRSSQPSWLEVKTATGKTLFRGSFQGNRGFPLNGGLEVLAGRPDLVRAQLGAGASQPLGRIDQVRWRRFTAPAP